MRFVAISSLLLVLTACSDAEPASHAGASTHAPIVKSDTAAPKSAVGRVEKRIASNFSSASANRISDCSLATTVMSRMMNGQVSEDMIDAQLVFVAALKNLREASTEANRLFFEEYKNLPYDMNTLSSAQKARYSRTNSSCIKEASK